MRRPLLLAVAFVCVGAATSSCSNAPASTASPAPADAGTTLESGSGDDGEASAAPPTPDPTAFSPTGALHVAAWNATATLLPSGKVLIIGGQGDDGAPLTRVELYDPASKSFTSLPPLPQGRNQHTATLLADGNVLVVGGGTADAVGVPDGTATLKTALVYDPVAGQVVQTSQLNDARAAHTATLLPSGQVLVVGGGGDHSVQEVLLGAGGTGPVAVAIGSAEIYDPASNAWSRAGSLATARFLHTAELLIDGRVLVVAGATNVNQQSLATAEIYDPAAGQFSSAGALQHDRLYHVSARLPSGRVMVSGGKKANVGWLTATEVFDPTSGVWSLAGPLSYARTGAAATLLPTGHVLVAGGDACGISCADQPVSEVFDEASGSWTHGPTLKHGRGGHTQTLLPDGTVLVAGGVDETSALSSCELGAAN